jgi:hypothetical protein
VKSGDPFHHATAFYTSRCDVSPLSRLKFDFLPLQGFSCSYLEMCWLSWSHSHNDCLLVIRFVENPGYSRIDKPCFWKQNLSSKSFHSHRVHQSLLPILAGLLDSISFCCPNGQVLPQHLPRHSRSFSPPFIVSHETAITYAYSVSQ